MSISKIIAIFTPIRRKAIYGLATAIGAALVAFNAVDADALSTTVDSIVAGLTALATLMAALNTPTKP
jgi:hypothetical protein